MATLTGASAIFSFNPYTSNTAKEHRLGQLAQTVDGRRYRYALAGGSALVAGHVLQSAAQVANHAGMTTAAAAIGATTITVTLGATAVTANQYAEGYLSVNASTGLGLTYTVKSHPAADASATLVLTLEEPIKVATTTSSKTTLFANKYSKVIDYPTTPTGVVVGVAPFAVTAAEYCWIQVGGPCAVLSDAATFIVGAGVSPSNATAGAAETQVVAQGYIGNALALGVSAEYQMVDLNIN